MSQLSDVYARFLRLTALGQTNINEFGKLPPDVLALRGAVFSQSDFGAIHSGQWLPHAERTRIRAAVKAEIEATRAGEV